MPADHEAQSQVKSSGNSCRREDGPGRPRARINSRADELQSVESTLDELRDLDQECDEFEHSLTKLQEELEAESTNELE